MRSQRWGVKNPRIQFVILMFTPYSYFWLIFRTTLQLLLLHCSEWHCRTNFGIDFSYTVWEILKQLEIQISAYFHKCYVVLCSSCWCDHHHTTQWSNWNFWQSFLFLWRNHRNPVNWYLPLHSNVFNLFKDVATRNGVNSLWSVTVIFTYHQRFWHPAMCNHSPPWIMITLLQHM